MLRASELVGFISGEYNSYYSFCQVNLLFDGSYSGINQGALTLRMELSPSSIIVSRTSAFVWPTRAIGLYPSFAIL